MSQVLVFMRALKICAWLGSGIVIIEVLQKRSRSLLDAKVSFVAQINFKPELELICDYLTDNIGLTPSAVGRCRIATVHRAVRVDQFPPRLGDLCLTNPHNTALSAPQWRRPCALLQPEPILWTMSSSEGSLRRQWLVLLVPVPQPESQLFVGPLRP